MNHNAKLLMSAVVKQAYDDVVKYHDRIKRLETYRAMKFILSDTCEAYCLETGNDYYKLRKQAAESYRRIFTGVENVKRVRRSFIRTHGKIDQRTIY